MERKERIKILGEIKKEAVFLEDIFKDEMELVLHKNDLYLPPNSVQAIQETIAEAELMEKVASGGVEKREVCEFCQDEIVVCKRQLTEKEKCIKAIGFNSAIDLCNAHWVGKINKIQEAIQILGKPTMNYAPEIAIKEYDMKIKEALDILIKLTEVKQFNISSCCNASIRIIKGTDDLPNTVLICEACNKPCDLAEWNKAEVCPHNDNPKECIICNLPKPQIEELELDALDEYSYLTTAEKINELVKAVNAIREGK